MRIEVLGPGCPRCHQTLEAVRRAVAELGLAAEVVYVTDLKEIMKAGILATPAVLVNGEVRFVGQVPALDEVKKVLREGR